MGLDCVVIAHLLICLLGGQLLGCRQLGCGGCVWVLIVWSLLICVMAHCWGRGAEVLLGDKSHIHIYEQAGLKYLHMIPKMQFFLST